MLVYIEKNIRSDIEYHDLEAEIGFSYRYIRELFQKVTSVSLSRYILNRRIANTAFEIRHTLKNITEIAFEYGFENPDTFTRAFRRVTGMMPSEFRKSNHHCGRRIICPGVYAPVILDLENPRYTLTKIKDVNEMGEMVKTTDSCVLYGVPKIYYGLGSDGYFQGTPFPMCLQSVLNYMGQNINYTRILAASGAAFRQRWNVNGWDFGAIDIQRTYDDPLKPFKIAFAAAGRSYQIYEESDKSKSKTTYLEAIQRELDCGRPVICLGVVGPPEACIVTGYKENGEILLGWNLWQGTEWDKSHTIDMSGYFQKDRWWENTECVMSIGEDVGESAHAKDILANAVMLMKQEQIEIEKGKYYCGQAAYEAWAKMVENDAAFAEGVNLFEASVSHEDQESMCWEGRIRSSHYMDLLAEQYPTLACEFAECGRLLKSACDCVMKMQSVRGGRGQDEIVLSKFKERQVREQIAAFIREAAVFEKKACATLEKIIEKL